MSSEDKHIDDLFREKINSLQTGDASRQADWSNMEQSLNQPGPGPKKGLRKKITRRWITYMGLAALVTTVTYYAVKNKATYRQQNTSKQMPVKQKPAIRQPVMLVKTSPIILAPKPKNNSHPVSTTSTVKPNKSNLVLTTVRTKSDTAFVLTAPSPKEKPSMITTGGNFFNKLKDPEQHFEIITNRDTVLFGKEGTVLHIPQGAFYTKTGKVSGTVKIGLVECYTYPQMLAYGLSTNADGQPLVSGGMIRINASKEGEPLLLYNGKQVGVSMPMEKYDPEMQLFLPKKTLVPVDNPVAATMKKNIESGADISLRLTLSDTLATDFVLTDIPGNNWRPAGQNQSFANYRRYVSQKQVKLFNIQQKVTGINASDHAEFIVDAGPHIADEKIKQLLFSRYSAAGIKKISIKRENVTDMTKAKSTNVSISSKGFVGIDSMMMNIEKAMTEKLVNRSDSMNFEIQKRIDSIAFFEKVKADSLEYVRKMEFNKAYNFNISDLGWINCDKFMRSSQPMVDFSIPLDPSTGQQYAKFHLVFTNSKSVLDGRYANGLVNFGKLPVGEAVNVVCVAEKNGVAVGCIQKTVTGPSAMATLKFEPITPDDFKNKLMQL